MKNEIEQSILKFNRIFSRLENETENKGVFYEAGDGYNANASRVYRTINIKFNNGEDALKKLSTSAFVGKHNPFTVDLNNMENLHQKEAILHIQKVMTEKDLILNQENFDNFFNLSPIQEKMILDFVVAHEMSHIYFSNINNPTYDPNINAIQLVNAGKSVGNMRDENRADVLAILLLQKEYGKNNPELIDLLDKIKTVRLGASTEAIIDNSSPYNMFHIYKNNMEFFKDLPEINKNTLSLIEKKVDDVVLQTLKDFGIQQAFYGNNPLDEFTQSIQDKKDKILDVCENLPSIKSEKNLLSDSIEKCFEAGFYQKRTLSEEGKKVLSEIPIYNEYQTVYNKIMQDKQNKEDFEDLPIKKSRTSQLDYSEKETTNYGLK